MRGRRAVVPLLTLMLATLLELSSVAAKSITFGEAQAAQAPAATELTGVEVGRNADGVTVTLKGNGKLAYGTLQEADRPLLPVMDHRGGDARALAALALVDVLDDLLAPLVLEVHIDIRRLAAFGGNEALEQQIDLRRIDRSDEEAVAHRRIGR